MISTQTGGLLPKNSVEFRGNASLSVLQIFLASSIPLGLNNDPFIGHIGIWMGVLIVRYPWLRFPVQVTE
ncbi:hypothetical protein BO71DRAFT_75157 [Aspergillus ellipticus CBS 707.79]|uniref:Uncharacterized protein n=1 Tax=Aspergillus ellipticus CBS 707.79 TaxID=1448320 RepID=A0A319CYV3_9EURO|nr:hypothetical protein BO71DRAFT_75157 [Aspergillus ellipticus CBS 707.79]